MRVQNSTSVPASWETAAATAAATTQTGDAEVDNLFHFLSFNARVRADKVRRVTAAGAQVPRATTTTRRGSETTGPRTARGSSRS